MLTAILFTIAGIALGQFIRIDVDPTAIEFLRSTWAQLDKLIGEAIPALSEWRDRAVFDANRAGTMASAIEPATPKGKAS